MSSASYNDLLSHYPNKGLCGDEEFDHTSSSSSSPSSASSTATDEQAKQLAALVSKAERCVVYTGAGISTSCGLPDFRGPDGVWTCEMEGREAPEAVAFEEAVPSLTHRVLAWLVAEGLVSYVVTQNVDDLHGRSGMDRERLAELHGNLFVEQCEACARKYVRAKPILSVGFKATGRVCEDEACGGVLRDTALDWDSELPEDLLDRSIRETKAADLCVCLGTSLRIRPAGNLPMRCVRRNGKPAPGKLAIVNLQRTHLDSHSTLRIFARVDYVMRIVAQQLGAPEYVISGEPPGTAGASSRAVKKLKLSS